MTWPRVSMRHTSSWPTKQPFVNDTASLARGTLPGGWCARRCRRRDAGRPRRRARLVGVGDRRRRRRRRAGDCAHRLTVGARTDDVDGVFAAPVDGQHDRSRRPPRPPRRARARAARAPRSTAKSADTSVDLGLHADAEPVQPSASAAPPAFVRHAPPRVVADAQRAERRDRACPAAAAAARARSSPTATGSRSWESRLCRNEVASGPRR